MTNRNFLLYAIGRLVSLIGTGIQDVAVPLFILDLTGSGTAMGTFMIITVVPRLILVPLAGVIGDRVNRKWIMVWMDFGRGLTIMVLIVLASQEMITIPVLFFAQLIISLMNALFGPATMAMLPDIVADEYLVQANSILGSINSISFIIGPALGGIIYGLGGIKIVFLVNSVSFLLSGLSELFIIYEQKTTHLGKMQEVVYDLVEGIRFVKGHTGLFIILMVALILNFLANPLFSVLFPYVMRLVIQFSSSQFGFLEAAFVTGTLLGNIIIGTWLAHARLKSMVIRGLVCEVVSMGVFAGLIIPSVIHFFGYGSWDLFIIFFFVLVINGLFNAFVNTPLLVEIQRLAPTEFRARVFSVLEVMSQGVVPIGFGIMGILLDIIQPHVVALSVILLLMITVLFFGLKYADIVFEDLNKNNNRSHL
ncbi:MAG: MFS transporter [Theionarchaea archaeon]|nr:MFS transporter [Theionarchaea archaeon]